MNTFYSDHRNVLNLIDTILNNGIANCSLRRDSVGTITITPEYHQGASVDVSQFWNENVISASIYSRAQLKHQANATIRWTGRIDVDALLWANAVVRLLSQNRHWMV